jgi:bifunctional DNA-binding transcriptional regulator/antitoxin component of YhaV-PrlF toxin-antitoxin module
MGWEVVPIRRQSDFGLTAVVGHGCSLNVRQDLKLKIGSRFKILHNVATGEFALAPVKDAGPNVKSMSAKKPRFTCELLISTMNLKPGDELLATENEPGIFVLSKIGDEPKAATVAPADQTPRRGPGRPRKDAAVEPQVEPAAPQDPDEQPEPQESHAPPARKPRQFSRS